MTGGEILILLAIVMLAWIVRAEGKASDRHYAELVDRLAGLERKLETDLRAVTGRY